VHWRGCDHQRRRPLISIANRRTANVCLSPDSLFAIVQTSLPRQKISRCSCHATAGHLTLPSVDTGHRATTSPIHPILKDNRSLDNNILRSTPLPLETTTRRHFAIVTCIATNRQQYATNSHELAEARNNHLYSAQLSP